MADRPSKYARLQYAALICGEFFRDELQFGNVAHLSPRIAQRMQELKTECFDALGDISVWDAEIIRRKISAERTGLTEHKVSERTRLIREQQRSGGKEVTAIMVSPATQKESE